MKTILLSFAFMSIFAMKSQAAIHFDGCYQLYLPSVMYPVFCLDGTNEEGIGGSGARLVIFHPNSSRVSACGLSTAVRSMTNSFEFYLQDKKEIILSDIASWDNGIEGNATFGSSTLKFIQLSQTTTKHLLSKFYSEGRCEKVQPGSILKL